jgi:hypothetical protein
MHALSRRGFWTLPASLVLALAYCSLGFAASLCDTDRAASEKLSMATGKASARFLEAASQAFLAFKALEEGSDAVSAHSQSARTLLDEAIGQYKAALQLSDDLAQADAFLKQREFNRLQKVFGITRGTLNHTRWELIAKTAQKSQTPAADLVRVCVAGAESLKSVTAGLKPGISAVQVRRAAYSWHLVLMHGALVSDAFDASIR